ncbi:alpha/beta fold hydrolase [Enterocloster lavalensis]|uniref:alpha/beta fold hydrolase n=1 Tax=Enterocloster lavalensis TaxID=460384 RepID=UPI00266521E1|nr:alpha/beta hydrolase [Enterocloster lavalensis]
MAKDRIESKYFCVSPGIELHYLEKGEGRPLVFIPGLTFSGEIFKAQLEYFSGNYRVIAIDPRGQGLSAKTVDGNDYMTHGRDLAALIDGLGLDGAVLVGWSTGNLEVWSYIRQFGKEKLRGAVTIDMSPLPLSADPMWWTEGTMEELSEVATQYLTSPEGSRAFFSDYATGVMIQHEMEPAELEYLLDISGRTPYWVCKALFCDAIFSNFLETAREVGAGMPSLMFIAEHWADVARPFVEQQLPGYEIQVMGGHLMFYEYPEKWNGLLEEFLNRLP